MPAFDINIKGKGIVCICIITIDMESSFKVRVFNGFAVVVPYSELYLIKQAEETLILENIINIYILNSSLSYL